MEKAAWLPVPVVRLFPTVGARVRGEGDTLLLRSTWEGFGKPLQAANPPWHIDAGHEAWLKKPWPSHVSWCRDTTAVPREGAESPQLDGVSCRGPAAVGAAGEVRCLALKSDRSAV